MHIYVVDLDGRAIAGRGFGSQEAAEMILDERPIRELLAASAGMISRTREPMLCGSRPTTKPTFG
jgi:hypothetical protein